ncbi:MULTISPECIES: hypothetical protein [Mesorhizobium]|uniref:hypothetical protein n=1 Tax=Mesorhizobium TaxID=68287 RepID=UPI0011B66F58|nr:MULTISPECIES: hypothetical protein [Mesorhizobium]QKD15616.1 DUF4238 domain-containing protein [Mesorhizobium sp. NZP2077]
MSKTAPLAPDIAIRIYPKIRERGTEPYFSFPYFRARFRGLRPEETREVNSELVRAAEKMVFYNDDAEWLLPFLRKNRNYRVEALVDRIPAPGGGKMVVATQGVVPYQRPPLL